MDEAKRPTERRRIGIGLIGVGWMGRLHSMSYRRVADHFPECAAEPRLVIAADEVGSRARAAVEQLGYRAATTDPQEVIDHPEVDAVSITGPNHVHLPCALAAAAAGKHFWAEKPLGRFPEETLEIAGAARDAGIITTVGFNYRHAPMVQHACELIASGRLGKVRDYHGRFLVDYASNPRTALSWRFQLERAGLGVLGDLMSHVVDMALLMAGPIHEVCAYHGTDISRRPRRPASAAGHYAVAADGPLGDVENEDHAASLVQFANGGHGILEVSRSMVGPHCRMGFEVHGTLGALAWDFERMNELQLYVPATGVADTGYARVVAGPQHGHFARYQPGPGVSMGYSELKTTEAYLFLQSIADGVRRAPSAQEAEAVAEVLQAMRASCAARAWRLVVGSREPAGSRPC